MPVTKNIQLQRWVLVVGVVLFAVKISAYFLTSSNAILTDALESIVNIIAGGFALYSMILAAKPKDSDHPYGHGKIEFVSASLEGILIVLAGLIILGKSVLDFFQGHSVARLDWGLGLILFSGLINGVVGGIMIRRGKRTHSMILVAGGRHLLTDTISTAGIMVGLGLLQFTGAQWLDSATAVIFAVLIIISGIRILRRSVGGIMDEADLDVLKEIAEVLEANRKPEWIDVHNMRVIRYGSTLHVDCHLTVPYYFDVRRAHAEVDSIDLLLNTKFENRVEFFIHTDGCIESSCAICSVAHCPVRQHELLESIKWTTTNLMKNEKHKL